MPYGRRGRIDVIAEYVVRAQVAAHVLQVPHVLDDVGVSGRPVPPAEGASRALGSGNIHPR